VVRSGADFIPRRGAPACEFRLPPAFMRKVVCARAELQIARVSCQGNGNPQLTWGDGSFKLALSKCPANRVTAFWTGDARSTTAELLFRQGRQQVVFVIDYL
jgi:hypothetical protein